MESLQLPCTVLDDSTVLTTSCTAVLLAVPYGLLYGEVKMYDSCFSGKLSKDLQLQIAQIYRPAIRDGKILVTALLVQQ